MQSLWTGFLLLVTTASCLSQAPAPVREVEASARTDEAVPPRVAVIGASLSDGTSLSEMGFKSSPAYRTETIGLGDVFTRMYPSGAVSDHSDMWFFKRPIELGPQQAKRAADGEPALIVAMDFLFWYGYGGGGPGGARPKSSVVEEWRLEKQAHGFEQLEWLLEKTDAVIAIGDYPDMSEANPVILPKSAIPTYATLDELNARVAAFAKKHDRVHLFPLADLVMTLSEDGIEIEHDGATTLLERDHLMQLDKLHPTKLGAAILADRFCSWLDEVLPERHSCRREPISLDVMLDLTGGEAVLAEIRDGQD